MDNNLKPTARRVIPNWRYYTNTLQLGEQDAYSLIKQDTQLYPIDDYINDWIDKKSLYRASDLISAAICNSQKENSYVIAAAKYILESCQTKATSLQKSVAKYIVSDETAFNNPQIAQLNNNALEKLSEVNDVRQKIHELRIMAHAYPYNPIVYIDMARAYTIIGQMKKAENMIRIALGLDPHSRFAARAAARFYIHIGDRDKAAEIIRKTGYTKYDPWLMSAEIAIAMLRDKRSSNIKLGEQIIFSDNFTPFSITELASAIGTVELECGTRKKSKKIFNRSLVKPNDNSLAQAEWAVSNGNLSLSFNGGSVPYDYETKAYRLLMENNYAQALNSTVDWICDMPFSVKSVRLGYDLSTSYVKNYELSSKILEVGLKTHPNDKNMLNNRAYVSALDNNLNIAKIEIEKLAQICSINDGGTIPICMTATQGLILYREGQIKEGREKYDQAIKMAETLKDEEIIIKATLNKLREELIASDFKDTNSLNQLRNMIIPSKYETMTMLKSEIQSMIEKHCRV